MSKRKKTIRQPPRRREDEQQNSKVSSLIAFLNDEAFRECCSSDYIRLDECPEIVGAIRRIAETAGGMTIHLMKNMERGDVRIENELSRFLDITPCNTMNRSQFVEYIISEMCYTGNAVVKPKTRRGILQNLTPIPRERFSIQPDSTGYDYNIFIDGIKYDPSEVLHFEYNPDKHFPFIGQGLTIPLKELASCLKAGRKLEKDFMTSKYMPSIVVRADGMVERFQSKKGRDELAEEFLETEPGKPWIIPAEQITVQEVKPLSLADLAIDKTMEFDLRKLAALLGVPPFMLGIGQYNQTEWNNFVSTKVRSFVLYIAQEMTRKLIFSPDWYIRFNHLSALDFDIKAKADIYLAYGDRGYVTGNEARDAIGLPPSDDPSMDEHRVLENYIPADMAGNQKKLNKE